MTEENKLDWEDFKLMLHESWWLKMQPAIESDWMFKIYQTLKEDSKKERILPNSENVFKSFEYPLDEIKCIIYLGDPYPRLYKGGIPQATGIPMSCDNSPDGKIQPSLEKFYEAIDLELDCKVKKNKSLKYLMEQGCFLINTDLTVKKDKTASHKGLWEPFQKYLLEEVLGVSTNIIYVLCGKDSYKIEKYINPFCHIFRLEHPANASYSHRDWKSEGIFRKINNILKDNNLSEIMWNYDDWESPF